MDDYRYIIVEILEDGSEVDRDDIGYFDDPTTARLAARREIGDDTDKFYIADLYEGEEDDDAE